MCGTGLVGGGRAETTRIPPARSVMRTFYTNAYTLNKTCHFLNKSFRQSTFVFSINGPLYVIRWVFHKTVHHSENVPASICIFPEHLSEIKQRRSRLAAAPAGRLESQGSSVTTLAMRMDGETTINRLLTKLLI